MDKQKIIYMYSGILFTPDKEILTHATTQMKLWRYYAKWNKLVMNKYVDMNLLLWGTWSTQIHGQKQGWLLGVGGSQAGKIRSYYLMEFQFGKMNKKVVA